MKLLFLLIFITGFLSASDQRKQMQPAGLPTPPATPRPNDDAQPMVPIGILQNSENYIEYVTRSGEKLYFKVKLAINLQPHDQCADVTLSIFQGRKLITSRHLEFVW